jgi:AraC family transcriptional regulator
MPDPTSSSEEKERSLDTIVAKPIGNSVEARLFPGRGVSVMYGFPNHEGSSAGCAQVRVFVLFDAGAWCEIAFQAPDGEWRTKHVEGTKVIVIGPHVRHALKWSGDEGVVTLLLEPRFVHETAKTNIEGVMTDDVFVLGHRDALIIQLTDAFRALCRGEKRPTALYVECIGTVMATHVLHLLFGGEAPIDRRGGLPVEALQRVIAHIDAHFAEDYDPDILARISGFSRNHFSRLFEKSLAQTPRTYYRGCQVEHAITLLQTSDMKAIDIAHKCGFCDQTQMARWFWNLRNISPSEVRAAARQ